MLLLTKLRISPLLYLFVSIILLTDAVYGKRSFDILLVIYLSVFAHEVAHGVVGEFFGYKVKQLRLTCYGGCAEFENVDWLKNNRHKFYIAAAGPLINLLISCFCILINKPVWAELNLTFALFNLIPILPMDGAHILGAAIGKYTDNKLIPLFIGVFSGFAAALFFSHDNFLATIFLMFFTGLNVAQIYDLVMVGAPPQQIKHKKPKAKMLYVKQDRLFVLIGTDREVLDIVDDANCRLKTMSDIYPAQLIQDILNENNMDYEPDVRIV